MLREDAIEDVIRQFSDPMAFLRELVQNALDAGSQEVGIRFEHDEAAGMGVVTVADWGEGMTREIIESRLVRLFNSTKDDDFTKIGKFGIGFVSVFAVEPTVICVDTGRDGEYWRLLLYPDRSYELIALDHPVEGTTVDVHLQHDSDSFAQFVRAAREKVRRWCRFAPVPILFDGVDLREPFELPGLIVEEFEEEGTRAVAALHTELNGRGEFFNGGLALQATSSSWPHVSFLMDSRYFEHTLTRDQVLQNKKFHAAIARLNVLVEEQLLESVQAALASWAANPDRLWDWNRLCGIATHAYTFETLEAACFPVIGGDLIDVAGVRKAREKNRLMVTRGRSHIAHLMPADYVLLDVRPDGGTAQLLQMVIGKNVPVLEDLWVHPPIVDNHDVPGASALLVEVKAALRHLGSQPTWIGFGQFDYPFSGLENRGLICVSDRNKVHHRGQLSKFSLGGTNEEVLLNPSHPILADAVAVAVNEPEWAGYTVVKCAALAVEAVESGELDGETDAAFAGAMLTRRTKRLAR